MMMARASFVICKGHPIFSSDHSLLFKIVLYYFRE